MSERDAFLRSICETPDDDTPRLAFADWLQENGDEPRAEFIRVQIELARGGEDVRLRQREQDILMEQGERWAELIRGIGLRLAPFHRPTPARSHGIEYRRGFPFGVEIADEYDEFADRASKLFQLAPIQRIVLYYQHQYEKTARCPELLRVRELSLDRSGFGTADLEVLFRTSFLKNLVRLDLIADEDNGHIAPEGLRVLGRATCLPALRYLDLSYNYSGWWMDGGIDWMTCLLEGELVEQLESLRLCGSRMDDLKAEMLAGSRRVRSLTHLDLSGNCIGDRGLRALAASPNFTNLAILDLRENSYETDDGEEVVGYTSETRQLLEARFENRVLLDGKMEPHPLP